MTFPLKLDELPRLVGIAKGHKATYDSAQAMVEDKHRQLASFCEGLVQKAIAAHNETDPPLRVASTGLRVVINLETNQLDIPEIFLRHRRSGREPNESLGVDDEQEFLQAFTPLVQRELDAENSGLKVGNVEFPAHYFGK